METNDRELFLTSVTETDGFTYRKIFRVDLDRNRCTILKSDPEGWQPAEGPVTEQLARFALDGNVHWQDAERFVTFTRLDQLRQASAGEQKTLSMIYRRKAGSGFRWNLLEVIPDRHGESRFVTLCVKDVDDLLREGVQREGLMSQSQEMLRDLEDRAYIISSLSSLFFSTYYVNLEQDTFRTVTQLGHVKDVLGDNVNYTAALNIYASHFIHPDDQEEYLQTMDLQNLKSSLRWWNPCVVFEYRRLSNESGAEPNSWSWVRASTILARTGNDDLPRTAVYVAQDLNGGRRGQN